MQLPKLELDTNPKFHPSCAAVPLVSRIHEGVVFSNRDARTLLDKLVTLLFLIVGAWNRQVLLIADAYYASSKVIAPLLANGHHLITRAKSNAVAYMPVPTSEHRGNWRPRIYGDKVRLKDLAQNYAAFTNGPSPVYGEIDVWVRYRVLDLMWRTVAKVVRFLIVHHPLRGTILLRRHGLHEVTVSLPLHCCDALNYPGAVRAIVPYNFSTDLPALTGLQLQSAPPAFAPTYGAHQAH